MARWEEFRQCPGCGYDIARDEGEKSCHMYDCPYLPEELDVFCPQCRFNLYTGEGNPSCDDPGLCEHAEGAREAVGRYQSWSVMAR